MDEKLRILKMVEEGTITAEQAAELMEAMKVDAPEPLSLIHIFSAIHSVISITWGGNQSVSSMALVLLATGFSGVGLKSIFGQQGSSPQVASLEHTPILAGIPVVGEFLADLSPFVYIAFLAVSYTNMGGADSEG